MDQTQVQEAIREVCLDLGNMLVEKNWRYGNSALNPTRIFSQADTLEQINVRMDDKLSRIREHTHFDNEDAEWDLAGYLILKFVAKRLMEVNNERTNAATT